MFYKKARKFKTTDYYYNWYCDDSYHRTRKDFRNRHLSNSNVNKNIKWEMRHSRRLLKQFTTSVNPHIIKITLANRWNWD